MARSQSVIMFIFLINDFYLYIAHTFFLGGLVFSFNLEGSSFSLLWAWVKSWWGIGAVSRQLVEFTLLSFGFGPTSESATFNKQEPSPWSLYPWSLRKTKGERGWFQKCHFLTTHHVRHTLQKQFCWLLTVTFSVPLFSSPKLRVLITRAWRQEQQRVKSNS